MQLNKNDMDEAVKAKIITKEQSHKLWTFLESKYQHVPQFKFSHVLYYFGGLLAISAVTLFVTKAWETLTGLPLFFITILLFAGGCYLARYFLKKQLLIPAGIMCTFSLAVIPLAIYNLQLWLGLLPNQSYQYSDFHYWINWYWVPMEIITLMAGFIMLYIFDFPFLVFPISIALWYLSMDLFALMFNVKDAFSWRDTFSMFFGLIIILLAVYIDFKNTDHRKDYAFWLYIVGVMTFWGGLSIQHSDSEASKFMYFLINLAMIFVSVFLDRRVFAVFGAFGVLGYLGHLAYSLFADSLLFPIVLIIFGIAIIFAATRWPKIEKRIQERMRSFR